MSPSKAKELDNRKDGDRNACAICNPGRGIPMDVLWEWQKAHPGERVFRTPDDGPLSPDHAQLVAQRLAQ